MPHPRTFTLRMLIAIVLLALGLGPGMVTTGAAAAAQSTPEASSSTPEPPVGPQFLLHPLDQTDGSYFTLEAEAGTTHTLTAVIGNVDTVPLSLRTYAGDAFTLVNGGFGVREEDEPKVDVGAWLDYPAETMDFQPGEGVERTFTVTVPEDTAPGEYIAGIVLQTAEPLEIEGSAMFNQIVRKSVAVFITVPGPVTPGFELGTPEIETSVAGSRVVVPVVNTGNVLVKPAGELVLTDASGNAAFTQPFVMGSVYAGMETTLEIPLPPALPVGEYQVTASFADEATQAEASIPQTAVMITNEAETEAPLEITSATVAPMPGADDVQFAAVSVTVTNRDIPVDGVRVVLNVARDGEAVEDFVLANSVTLQQGETVVEQRYIPLEGWTAGEWTFSVTLETIDPQTNAEATLVTIPVEAPIEVAGE